MRPKIDYISIDAGTCPDWACIQPQIVIRRDSRQESSRASGGGWYYMRSYTKPSPASMVRAFLAVMKLTERAKNGTAQP